MHCYIFSSVFLQLSVLTITISSNLISALIALFFTNHCVLSCNRTVTLANHIKCTQLNPTKPGSYHNNHSNDHLPYQTGNFPKWTNLLRLKKFVRAKSEALVNNTCKQKKLNRVMLNGDDNENGFKTNRSNQQKTNCTCSTPFLLISKKQICTCSTLFCLSLAVVLHDYNAVLYD